MRIKNMKDTTEYDSTYFRMSDITPCIESDCKGEYLEIVDFTGTSRSWGSPKCTTTVIVNKRNFTVFHVGFCHKHGGSQGWHYYTRKQGQPIKKVNAKQLTRTQMQMVLDNKHKSPSWAHSPNVQLDRSVVIKKHIKYKQVAVVDGKYVSIFSGEEYVLSKTKRQKAKQDHEGGYYCYNTIEEAGKAVYPETSYHIDSKCRAVLKCEVWGNSIRYRGNKEAWTYLKPIEAIHETYLLETAYDEKRKAMQA